MRLSQKDREALMQFARETVTSPETEARANEAYEAAATAVIAHVDDKFPPRDMQVLKRYRVAAQDLCINGGEWISERRFEFRKDDPRVPILPKYSFDRRTFVWSREEENLLDQYHYTMAAHKEAIDNKLCHYRALIIGAKSFEDITAVWPAAAKLQRKMDPKKPAILLPVSQASIDFIRQDNAGTAA